jgi:hypothetical protein
MHRSPVVETGTGVGNQAPGEGFALTLAEREVHERGCVNHHDAHDLATALALLAAKRASLVGRGPARSDVVAAWTVLGLPQGAVSHQQCAPFRGLAHDYFAQRRFADAVSADTLLNA